MFFHPIFASAPRFFRRSSWVAAMVLLGLGSARAGAEDATGPYDVTIAWDANPEPDVIGYRLLFGDQRGTYPNVVEAGNNTMAVIPGTGPRTFYVVAIAYNTAGLESLPSTELEVIVTPAADTVNPILTGLPSNIVTVPDSPGGATAVVTWTEPLATDNSNTVTLTSSHPSGFRFPAGSTIVTYTATDPSGNRTSASFTVTVGSYEVWQQQAFGAQATNPEVAGDTVNADGDRWSNLGEYALGLQASLNDGYDAFKQRIDGNQVVLDLFHNPALPDVVLRVECSGNLSTGWRPLATRHPTGEWVTSSESLDLVNERQGDRQKVTVKETIGAKSAAYYRLVVERPGIE